MAFVDTRSLADGEVIEADICVIGAGPAGLAIATAFDGDGTRIALLESGDIGLDDETQALAAGDVVGIPYPDLDVVRLRMLGGSTNHWGGNIRPMDAIDFECARLDPAQRLALRIRRAATLLRSGGRILRRADRSLRN